MSIVKRLMEKDGLLEVADHAFSDLSAREVDDRWLERASPKDQVAAIAGWFLARFCDPAEETPYMSSEGGYIWVHGGPYDATEQIEGRFDGIASEEAIQAAIEYVERDGIYDWAPTQLTYLDDIDDVYIDDRNEPTLRLEKRIDYLIDVLSLKGVEETKGVARNLVFVGLISALEAFLNETMLYWVSARPEVVQAIVTEHPKFKNQNILLGSIYSTYASLERQVKAHLRKVVWHRIDDAVSLFKHGLGIEIGFHRFKEEITSRQDIVHRFSEDSDGNPVIIEDADVRALAGKIIEFANEIDAKIAEIFIIGMDEKCF